MDRYIDKAQAEKAEGIAPEEELDSRLARFRAVMDAAHPD